MNPKNSQELAELLCVLKEHGVRHARLGDLEFTLGPEPEEVKPVIVDDRERKSWRGYSEEDLAQYAGVDL